MAEGPNEKERPVGHESQGRQTAEYPDRTGLLFCGWVKPERREGKGLTGPGRPGEPKTQPSFRPYSRNASVTVSNRRVRTHTHGGVAGGGRGPPPPRPTPPTRRPPTAPHFSP